MCSAQAAPGRSALSLFSGEAAENAIAKTIAVLDRVIRERIAGQIWHFRVRG